MTVPGTQCKTSSSAMVSFALFVTSWHCESSVLFGYPQKPSSIYEASRSASIRHLRLHEWSFFNLALQSAIEKHTQDGKAATKSPQTTFPQFKLNLAFNFRKEMNSKRFAWEYHDILLEVGLKQGSCCCRRVPGP